MKSGLYRFPFFTVFFILFLLVRFDFMVTLTGLWDRSPTILPWIVPVFSLYQVCQGQAKGLVQV